MKEFYLLFIISIANLLFKDASLIPNVKYDPKNGFRTNKSSIALDGVWKCLGTYEDYTEYYINLIKFSK